MLSTTRPSSGGADEGRLGVRRFRRGGLPELDWIGLRTREGGEEALGQRNRGGVVRLGSIPAGDVRRRFGAGDCREEERGRNNRRMELS
jgi:hypothetical protein